MDALTTIFTRRSIRKFTAAPVSDADIETLLKAAMSAPSACNAQAWRFIVVRSAEGRDAIARCNPYAQMAKTSPVSIIVCADLQAEKKPGYWPQDCAAAIENLMLAARALELGTVWTGIYPVEERVKGVQEAFGLPVHVMPLGTVLIGHPDESFREENRYDTEKIFHERWGQRG